MPTPQTPDKESIEAAKSLTNHFNLSSPRSDIQSLHLAQQIITAAYAPTLKRKDLVIEKAYFALKKYECVRRQMLSKTVSTVAFDEAIIAIESELKEKG
jgi:hypothetical protein